MRRYILAFLCFGFLASGLTEAAMAKRVALVIGNDVYRNLPTLRKSVNDAEAVAATLEEMDFKVLFGSNLTRRETNRKLADFEAEIAPGDQVFFFFAGHGVALGAENYLMPTDMPMPRPGEEGLVQDEAHAVNALIVRLQAKGAAASFFVLDACRDNPFAAKGVRSIGGSRGLTRVEAPTGVFVLFSAGLGQAALDRLSDGDKDPNSIFTRKLVPLLKTPGLSHVKIAKRLQEEVSALAQTVRHSQQPAYYDQIVGEIVLRPTATPEPNTPAPPSKEPFPNEAARTWQFIEGTSSPAVLKSFIDRFPGSVFADFATARLRELADDPSSEPPSKDKSAEERKQAAIEPDAQPAPPEPRPSEGRELIGSIQAALNQHGCNAGATDGFWGAKSRSAVEAFARQTKLSLDPVPSENLLSILKARQDTACSSAVGSGSEKKEQPRKAVEPRKPPDQRKAAVQPPAPPSPQPSTKVFRNPKLAGLPVDICLTKQSQCKGEAAQEFCRQQGYRVATDSKYVIFPATRHIASGGVCKPQGLVLCGGYSFIACAR